MKKLLRLISVATMLLAATTFMACSSDDDDDDSGARSVSARNSGSIVGVVLDNKGEPVGGATVTLGGKTTTTNKGGEFEITGVNPNDKSLITARKANTTTSTATDGATGGSLKTESTETALSTTASSVSSGETAYTLTVTKDGYLPGTISGVYVTYTETEEQEVTRANALLHGLQYDYQDVLKAYAATLSNTTATGSTATTTTTATEDTTATTTVQTGSNADRVFKDVSEAISALKNMYKTGSYTEYFSTFGKSTGLIPLDASFKGSLKLNLTSKEGSTWSGDTLKPTSKPTVHVTYDPNYTVSGTTVTGGNTGYTWAAQANENGVFEFKESLPSGVPLVVTVDSFQETIDSKEYWFSSDSMIVLVDNSGAESSTTAEAFTNASSITLSSKDVNHETYRFLLFAQNDKLWVTATNVEDKTSGVLLTTKDALTFTFNKEMKKVEVSASTGFENLKKDAYKAELSEDKKTVTFTPIIGYWKLAKGDTQPSVTLSAEAADGTTALYKSKFNVYFDTKVWVSVKEDKVSYGDYNDRLSLDSSIIIEFSKAMNEKVAVNLYDGNSTSNKVTTAYEEKWTDGKVLELKPKAKYWELTDTTKPGCVTIQIDDNYASSAEYYNTNFGYWKTGAAKVGNGATTDNCLQVYFDNYIDVTFGEKADASFPINFSKELRALTEKELEDNITVYYNETYVADGTYVPGQKVTDAKFALSSKDGKSTITVTAKNGDFEHYGYYYVSFKDKVFVATTGESILRKDTTIAKGEVSGKTPFVTPYTLGTDFNYISVTNVKELPATAAVASRAAFASNEEYLKVTFNKEIKKSALKVNTNDVKNYIDSADKTVVYLALSEEKLTDNNELKITGEVTNVAGTKKEFKSTDNTEIKTYYLLAKNYFKMIKSSLYDEKAAIAGKNDVVNQLIDASDADAKVTFTFDQNIEGATWTAELYDEDTVSARNLDNSLFKATPTAAGDVLTVTLNDGTKKLEANKKYFLSIKAVSKVNTEVVLFDSDKASIETTSTSTTTPTIYYGKLSNGTTYLCEKIINSTKVSGNKYVEISTKGYYVLKAAEDNVTTTFAKFNESRNSQIKIQFNQKLTADWKAVLGLATATQPDTYDALVLTDTYASKADVANDVITITPTYTLPSETQINPWVFDAKGKKVDLKLDEVVNNEHPVFIASTGASKDNAFFTKDTKTNDVDLSKEIENGKADTRLTLTQLNAGETGTGSMVYLQFNPIITDVGTSDDYGSYTLYRKVTKAATKATKWVKVGKPYKIGGTGDYLPLEYVDTAKEDKVTAGTNERVATKQNAVVADFAVRGLPAVIAVNTAADEFNKSLTSEYKLVCTLDNSDIYSPAKTITDTKVTLKSVETSADGSTWNNAEDPTGLTTAEAEFTGFKQIKVALDGYMLNCTAAVKLGPGTTPATPSQNRIKAENLKITVTRSDVENTPSTAVIALPSNVTAAKGDTITITVLDAQGKKAEKTITFN